MQHAQRFKGKSSTWLFATAFIIDLFCGNVDSHDTNRITLGHDLSFSSSYNRIHNFLLNRSRNRLVRTFQLVSLLIWSLIISHLNQILYSSYTQPNQSRNNMNYNKQIKHTQINTHENLQERNQRLSSLFLGFRIRANISKSQGTQASSEQFQLHGALQRAPLPWAFLPLVLPQPSLSFLVLLCELKRPCYAFFLHKLPSSSLVLPAHKEDCQFWEHNE